MNSLKPNQWAMLGPLQHLYMNVEENRYREAAIVAKVLHRASITNGYPESGGGGASATESACTEATGTDAAPEASSDDDDGGDGDGDPDGRQLPCNLPPPSRQPCNAAKYRRNRSPEKPRL